MQQVVVIGISAPTGGGKTTLVRCLAKNLKGAIVLSFDEYDQAGAIVHPESHRTWYESGADYNAWQATCDLVVDGLLPPGDLARKVIRAAAETKASK